MKVMSLGSERAKMNIYQISSKNIHRFSRYYTFTFVYFFGISAVSSDFILEVRRLRQMLRANSKYHRVLQNVLVKHLKIVRYLR